MKFRMIAVLLVASAVMAGSVGCTGPSALNVNDPASVTRISTEVQALTQVAGTVAAANLPAKTTSDVVAILAAVRAGVAGDLGNVTILNTLVKQEIAKITTDPNAQAAYYADVQMVLSAISLYVQSLTTSTNQTVVAILAYRQIFLAGVDGALSGMDPDLSVRKARKGGAK